ncbi:MAG: glycosyltransferase [Candidatus Paceibacterota bacterium]
MTPVAQEGAKVVFVSTYPPTECGIATFTQDLVTTFNTLYAPREQAVVLAVTYKPETDHSNTKSVIDQIYKEDVDAYAQAAHKLNALDDVKLVSVQHEFGLYAGEYGRSIIDFLEVLEKPSVVTFHTVLPGPDKGRKQTIRTIAQATCGFVVMTETSKYILVNEYGIDDAFISIIPHGIHSMRYTLPSHAKSSVGRGGVNVLTTFGLLSRGKGIEYVIEAMPEIVRKHPDAIYQVLGATHPEVLRQEGEVYRQSLEKRVGELGLNKHVLFHNAYMSNDELLRYLKATDIYISTPLDPDQAVSGTLTYAMGAGRPVVATKFAQAKEDVTPDVGRLVDFREPDEISQAVNELLDDSELRSILGRNAYFKTRSMTWENVLLQYRRLFGGFAPNTFLEERNLPRPTLKHFHRMTDKTGMFQFAELADPDSKSGYTLDDNARALIACSWWYQRRRDGAPLSLATRYLDLMAYMMSEDGTFHNYVNHDKSFHEERNQNENLEDANARAFWSLATIATADRMPEALREKASRLFDTHIDKHAAVRSPRAEAFYIKALGEWLKTYPDNVARQRFLVTFADHLVSLFEQVATDDWYWCEPHLTYSNSVIPEALLIAGIVTGDVRYATLGFKALDFLVEHSFDGSLCAPVGQQGWFVQGGEKRQYDQQPEEVSALVQVLDLAYRISGKEQYRERRLDAFNWFLGNNSLHRFIYDHTTGGCYDGLGEGYVNLNQGAESTVTYVMARLLFEPIRKDQA